MERVLAAASGTRIIGTELCRRGHNPEYQENLMAEIVQVSSTEFASKFGRWSFEAQRTPIEVTNQKTGVVLGYFVSAQMFEDYLRVRDRLPKAFFAWEMSEVMAAELNKPAPPTPELDHLMKD
jgi:hypothetical protein